MNILLTGTSGFLGSRFLQYYKHKHNITALNRNDLDLTDEAAVYSLFAANPFDMVFHTAAMADVGQCEENPATAQRINVDATVNIAKGCEAKKSILVFASSDQIYKGAKVPAPYTEDSEISLSNRYAQTKWDAEQRIASLTERYFCLRLTWMFSGIEEGVKNNKNFFTNLLTAVRDNVSINLFANQSRGLTDVYEVIANIEKIICLPSGVYNAGSENNLSTYEVGLWMLECLGCQRKNLIVPTKAETTQDFRISNQKLKQQGVVFSDTKEAIQSLVHNLHKNSWSPV